MDYRLPDTTNDLHTVTVVPFMEVLTKVEKAKVSIKLNPFGGVNSDDTSKDYI